MQNSTYPLSCGYDAHASSLTFLDVIFRLAQHLRLIPATETGVRWPMDAVARLVERVRVRVLMDPRCLDGLPADVMQAAELFSNRGTLSSTWLGLAATPTDCSLHRMQRPMDGAGLASRPGSTETSPMLQSKPTKSENQPPDARRYSVRLGALVSGFGSHGTPCWITQLSGEDMRLRVAEPAVLSAKRLKGGRTVVVHLSHRTGETWRTIQLRATVIGAKGNSFRVRLIAPEPNVIDGLLRALLVQGRAKALSGRAAETTAPTSSPVPRAAPTLAPQMRRIASDLSAIAQKCREVVQEYGVKWLGSFLDRAEQLLFAHISEEGAQLLKHRLDECCLSLLVLRDTLTTEFLNRLTGLVNELFTPPQGRRDDIPARDMGRSLELIGTVDLNQSLAFNEAIDFLERTTAPAKMVHLEQRMTQWLGERIDERNNPLRVDRVCVLALGIICQHWYPGASSRQILNDALRDSGSALCAFYDALNAALEVG